jgi:hypothetical protein
MKRKPVAAKKAAKKTAKKTADAPVTEELLLDAEPEVVNEDEIITEPAVVEDAEKELINEPVTESSEDEILVEPVVEEIDPDEVLIEETVEPLPLPIPHLPPAQISNSYEGEWAPPPNPRQPRGKRNKIREVSKLDLGDMSPSDRKSLLGNLSKRTLISRLKRRNA